MRIILFWGLYWGPLFFGKLPYRVQGLGFGVQGLGFRFRFTFCCFCGFGFGFQGFWFGFWALGLLVWSLGLRSLNIGVPSGTLEVLPMDKILHDFMEIMVAQFQSFRYVRSCRILSINCM